MIVLPRELPRWEGPIPEPEEPHGFIGWIKAWYEAIHTFLKGA